MSGFTLIKSTVMPIPVRAVLVWVILACGVSSGATEGSHRLSLPLISSRHVFASPAATHIFDASQFPSIQDAISDETNPDAKRERELGRTVVVYVPEGVYTLNDGLLIPSNTALVGAGPGKTVLRLADNVDTSLPNTPARLVQNFTWSGTLGVTGSSPADHDIAIMNMTLDGNKANQTLPATGVNPNLFNIITLFSVQRAVIRNCEVLNSYGEAIRLTGLPDASGNPVPSRNVTISNCKVLGNPVGNTDEGGIVLSSVEDVAIVGNTVRDMIGPAIKSELAARDPLRRILVAHNRVSNATAGISMLGNSQDPEVLDPLSQRISIIGNTVTNISGPDPTGILLQFNPHSLIANNDIQDVRTTIPGNGAGMGIWVRSFATRIVGNSITNVDSFGIEVLAYDDTQVLMPGPFVIADNSITKASGVGIFLISVLDSEITRNNISETRAVTFPGAPHTPGGVGIFLSGTEVVVLLPCRRNNLIANTVGRQAYGIYEFEGADFNTVAANIFVDISTAKVVLPPGSNSEERFSEIRITGDVNRDGVVNMADLIIVAASLGTSGGVDLNGDGLTDILDLVLVSINFGRGDP